MSEEIIIGYDVRISSWANSCNWDEKRKRSFLLRLDVESPFSTDRVVWPSVLQDCPKTSFTGHQGLYMSFNAVEEHITQLKASKTVSGNVIAISLLLKSCTSPQEQHWRSILPIVNPLTCNNGWRFLGYDVSDMWLLSATANCGFLPNLEDVESLRKKWASRLNRNHLFYEKRLALTFKDFADERVKEHSPFFVFGLWLIQQLDHCK